MSSGFPGEGRRAWWPRSHLANETLGLFQPCIRRNPFLLLWEVTVHRPREHPGGQWASWWQRLSRVHDDFVPFNPGMIPSDRAPGSSLGRLRLHIQHSGSRLFGFRKRSRSIAHMDWTLPVGPGWLIKPALSVVRALVMPGSRREGSGIHSAESLHGLVCQHQGCARGVRQEGFSSTVSPGNCYHHRLDMIAQMPRFNFKAKHGLGSL